MTIQKIVPSRYISVIVFGDIATGTHHVTFFFYITVTREKQFFSLEKTKIPHRRITVSDAESVATGVFADPIGETMPAPVPHWSGLRTAELLMLC